VRSNEAEERLFLSAGHRAVETASHEEMPQLRKAEVGQRCEQTAQCEGAGLIVVAMGVPAIITDNHTERKLDREEHQKSMGWRNECRHEPLPRKLARDDARRSASDDQREFFETASPRPDLQEMVHVRRAQPKMQVLQAWSHDWPARMQDLTVPPREETLVPLDAERGDALQVAQCAHQRAHHVILEKRLCYFIERVYH
jgi:hypothetical protein